MYIIKSLDNNEVLDYSESIKYQKNGYPVLRPDTNLALAYPLTNVEVIEVSNIPDDFVATKYLYVDGSFEVNPDYTEPNKYGIADELLEQIKDDTISEIEQEVANGTN